MPDSTAAALLALWNGVEPALDAAYNEWHAQEHVPERLGVPGFLWGRRYALAAGTAATAPRYLTLYGLRDAGVLDSEPYLRLLREPTPMSRRMRPSLTNISRWVCTLHEADGLDLGSRLWTWASADRPETRPPGRGPQDNGPLGRLVAERRPEAAALPWLQTGQGHAIEGRWLLCIPGDETLAPSTPSLSAATLYARLPVG